MSLSVEGFVVLDIAKQKYTLSGSFSGAADKPKIVVEYHKPFAEAISLGTIDDIIVDAGNALVGGSSGGQGFQDQWFGTGGSATKPTQGSTLYRIQQVPLLGPVFNSVLQAQIRITDLGINTVTSTYQFGFAFDFTNENDGQGLELGPIHIQAFGAKITYQKPA